MRRVGVRELKQNASAVLASVKQGELVEVTERGRAIAVLVPADRPLTREEEIAAGLLVPATVDYRDVRAPNTPVPSGLTSAELLAAMRAED